MQSIINFLRGSAHLEVTGAFPERFLNLCAQNGVAFWGVEWPEAGELHVTVARRDRAKAARLAERVLCDLTVAGSRGAPAFLARFRRRYALLLGLALSLATVCVLSQFILTVEVSGNTNVTSAEILTSLRRLGVRPGSYGPNIDEAMVGQQLLMRVPGLSWCAVNLKGTVAEVLVREAVLPPALLDEDTLGDVYAEAPGIVTHMEVLEGEATVEEGSTVLAGDLLIAGNIHMEKPEYSNIDLGWRQVKAQGQIYARTWRTISAEIPLKVATKTYTGEEKQFWSLTVLGERVNFYGNAGISYARYDKINRIWTAELPGGREMPLSLACETVRAYETATAEINRDAAETLLCTRLDEALRTQIEDGEVVSTDYAVRVEGEKLIVTLTAECKEEIGKFVPFPNQNMNETG